MTFYVGQKVVCIYGGAWGFCRHGEVMPKLNAVYTVRQIVTRGSNTGLLLNEIVNPVFSYADGEHEPAFYMPCFRPLEEKPDAIEVFRAIAAGGDIRPGGDGLDVRVPDDVHAFGGRPIL